MTSDYILYFILMLVCIINFIFNIVKYVKKRRQLENIVGTLHVNLSHPEEEFFTCTVDESFFKSVCGPKPTPTVTFAVVIDSK